MCEALKDELYRNVKQESRTMAKLGNAIGSDWLENEGKKNVENPGRAVGKIAASAATWWLGNYGGDYGASAAGSAAGAGAGAAGSAAANVGAGALTATQSQLVNTIAQDPSMWSGLLGQFGANMGDKQSQAMMKMGAGMMDGGQQQPQPMGAPPPQQQASQEPLPQPYQNSLQGPPPGMTREEWERLKRMKQPGLLGRM